MQLPACSPSANELGKPADKIVLKDLDHNATETIIPREGQELGEADSLSNASLENITKDIDEFYTLCMEMDVQPLEDSWILDGSFEVPSSPQAALGAATDEDAALTMPGSRAMSFTAWTRSGSDSDEIAVPVIEEPQKLLKKVVTGGAWAKNGGGGTTRTMQETGIKNHVISERKRREKLNEMFLVLKSLIPSIRKVTPSFFLSGVHLHCIHY